MVERRTKQENQTDEAPKEKENANSAQARKDQKRREASCVAQTQPLRKRLPVWKKRWRS
ncbi:ABC transporter ATP-binding protein [Escherichia coli]|uniref:ABC transporter ATP-binding protein n=1 Tax=Escherichia coli TaxID=562 RepID=A0A376MJR1_ECOLX|nr:ABC transporter ATP-binding protein [Escherichia coli]